MILNCFFVSCFLIFITKFTVVHSALVSETTLKEGLFHEDHSFHKSCTVDNDCRGNKQYCNTAIKLCECQSFFEYRIDTSNCSPCPVEGEQCMGCCSNFNLRCYHNVCTRCDDDYYECDNAQNVFMNASQIALVAALIMGAAALATLLYRICTKPSYFRSRRIRSNRNAEATDSEFQRVSRASLTSLQIRVISRLRDRPPKYETQHNYDMRIQRREDEVQRTTDANIEINNPNTPTPTADEHAPPPYGSKESVHESPPPYSDTGHEVLPEIILGNRHILSQIGGTSQSNETISIISNACPGRDVINTNKSQSDNKEDKSIHM